MKKLLLVLVSCIITIGMINAQNDTITGWTFPVDNGSDSLNANYGTDQNMAFSIRFEDDGTGTQGDITFTNGASDFAATADGWDNGADNKYWLISFQANDFKDMVLYSKQRSGGNKPGPKYFKIQYRINSISSWTDLTTTDIEVANDWTTGVANGLALPATLNNCQETVFIRWLMASNESSGGGTVAADGVSKIDEIFIIGLNNEDVEELVYANVKVFPNPVTEILTIKAPFDVKRAEIYSISGALVKSVEGNNIQKMNVENLSAGKYILNLYNESSLRATKKMIKKD